jgi:uncharacterized phage protein (TIGR02220 family)
MNHQSYYAVIPANVRYSKDISDGAKLLYGEITALANQSGYCWATNKYFADLYGKSADTVSRWISELSAAGFIITLVDSTAANSRKIWIAGSPGVSAKMPTPIGKNADTLSAKMPTPIGKNAVPYKENNTKNNTGNITKKESAGASDPLTPPFQKVGEIDPETFDVEAEENHSPHRGPALRVSITDPELPGVTVVEEIAPGPKTKPAKTGRTQQAEEEIETAARVIAHLNEKTGRKFRVNVGANCKGIIARMREGFTESQMRTVIDYKCRTWLHDSKMSEYLNPETLFRPSNFENYLQAASSITVQIPKAQQSGRQSLNHFGGGEYPVDEVQKF